MLFSTDTPPLFFEMEGVQEVSLHLDTMNLCR